MIELAMLTMGFCVSAFLTPVGISGAFLLVPFQTTVLGVSSISVTPTNLLFNVIATPGAVVAFHREGRLDRRLAAIISAGSLPGVVVGTAARVSVLADPHRFRAFMGLVLIALAGSLMRNRDAPATDSPLELDARTGVVILATSAVIGVVGGIYGVGGGAFLAPLLALGTGCSLRRISGATLVGTLVTSIAGVASYAVVAGASGDVAAGPDWRHGLFLGVGGLLGGYVGASNQGRLPEQTLRRLLTVAVAGLGAYYLLQSLLLATGSLASTG